MRLPLRVLVVATALAVPGVTAAPSSAGLCVYWQPHQVYPGVMIPTPTQIDLSC